MKYPENTAKRNTAATAAGAALGQREAMFALLCHAVPGAQNPENWLKTIHNDGLIPQCQVQFTGLSSGPGYRCGSGDFSTKITLNATAGSATSNLFLKTLMRSKCTMVVIFCTAATNGQKSWQVVVSVSYIS